jgi:hypothetical protein
MAKRKKGWGGRRAGAGRKDTDMAIYGEPTVPIMLRVPRTLLISLRGQVARERERAKAQGVPGPSLPRWIVAILRNALNP